MGVWTLYIDESGSFSKRPAQYVLALAVEARDVESEDLDHELRTALDGSLLAGLWPPHAAKQTQSLLVAAWANGYGASRPYLSAAARQALEEKVSLPEDPTGADEVSLLFALTRPTIKTDPQALRDIHRALASKGKGPVTDPDLAPVQMYRALDLAVATLAGLSQWSDVLDVLGPSRLPAPVPLKKLDNELRRRLPPWAWCTLSTAWTNAWSAIHAVARAHDLTATVAIEATEGAASSLPPSRYEAMVIELLRGSLAPRDARIEVQGRHIRPHQPMTRRDVESMVTAAGRDRSAAAGPVAFERPDTHGAHVLADYAAHDAWARVMNGCTLAGLKREVLRRTGVRLDDSGIVVVGTPAGGAPPWLRAIPETVS